MDKTTGGTNGGAASVNRALIFDSYKFVRHLTNRGFTEEQASALAEAWVEDRVNLLNSNLVTDERLAATEARLNGRIGNLEERINARIANLKSELIIWMVGTMLAMTGVFAALSSLPKG